MRVVKRRAVYCFNRSILECKLASADWKVLDVPVLIDPYWNVNLDIDEKTGGTKNVLIDPYWNVNPSISSKLIFGSAVLIDPYWNVNPVGQLNEVSTLAF